ncbi:hypothetical protein BV25DRAFT_1824015 [Artomyces pyxidatus]|uniref:Uncharacterized protein n=1 Tax=Artomyces pyxidatus TaxID=48021 RepID=A0ACB8T423_9AGAM|nr:hypothetical protein BV25DRAFT_1824015 [Artomyces pyxidatus]
MSFFTDAGLSALRAVTERIKHVEAERATILKWLQGQRDQPNPPSEDSFKYGTRATHAPHPSQPTLAIPALLDLPDSPESHPTSSTTYSVPQEPCEILDDPSRLATGARALAAPWRTLHPTSEYTNNSPILLQFLPMPDYGGGAETSLGPATKSLYLANPTLDCSSSDYASSDGLSDNGSYTSDSSFSRSPLPTWTVLAQDRHGNLVERSSDYRRGHKRSLEDELDSETDSVEDLRVCKYRRVEAPIVSSRRERLPSIKRYSRISSRRSDIRAPPLCSSSTWDHGFRWISKPSSSSRALVSTQTCGPCGRCRRV